MWPILIIVLDAAIICGFIFFNTLLVGFGGGSLPSLIIAWAVFAIGVATHMVSIIKVYSRNSQGRLWWVLGSILFLFAFVLLEKA